MFPINYYTWSKKLQNFQRMSPVQPLPHLNRVAFANSRLIPASRSLILVVASHYLAITYQFLAVANRTLDSWMHELDHLEKLIWELEVTFNR
jgi:hypothetical protein